MSLVLVEGRGSVAPGPVLGLRADGAVTLGEDVVARLQDDRVLLPDGREHLSVEPDGALRLSSDVRPLRLRVTPEGDLQNAEGHTLRVRDDGVTALRNREGEEEAGPFRVEGFTPGARSTAALLVVLTQTLRRPSTPAPAPSQGTSPEGDAGAHSTP